MNLHQLAHAIRLARLARCPVLVVPVEDEPPSDPPPRPCRVVETTGTATSAWTPVVHEGGRRAA